MNNFLNRISLNNNFYLSDHSLCVNGDLIISGEINLGVYIVRTKEFPHFFNYIFQGNAEVNNLEGIGTIYVKGKIIRKSDNNLPDWLQD